MSGFDLFGWMPSDRGHDDGDIDGGGADGMANRASQGDVGGDKPTITTISLALFAFHGDYTGSPLCKMLQDLYDAREFEQLTERLLAFGYLDRRPSGRIIIGNEPDHLAIHHAWAEIARNMVRNLFDRAGLAPRIDQHLVLLADKKYQNNLRRMIRAQSLDLDAQDLWAVNEMLFILNRDSPRSIRRAKGAEKSRATRKAKRAERQAQAAGQGRQRKGN